MKTVNEKINIVENGKSEYIIVRNSNASPSEITACTELQSYLHKISGVHIPVVTDCVPEVPKEIVVGKTNREQPGTIDYSELGDEGFIIKTEQEKLWLVGGRKRGALYAVYEFLDSYLGCRFYSVDFEKIPKHASISISIEEDKQLPVFESRNPFWYDVFDQKLSVKLKINAEYNRGVFPDELGGSVPSLGFHTLHKLAEMDRSDIDPCLTDEKVYQTVLKNVRAQLAQNPDMPYLSVSQNDIQFRDPEKECDSCRALYKKYGCWSGVYLEFVNRIAREIRDEYPNVKIHMFAYNHTTEPPKGITAEDNVIIQLCTANADCRHPLEDYNPAETNTYNKDFKTLLTEWAGICKYLAVWDYTTDFSHYSIPFANWDVLRKNIRLFADHNVRQVFAQGPYTSTTGEFSELRSYLIAKLLWNPYMSELEYQNMIDEFMQDFYGPGWRNIKEYMDILLKETEDVYMWMYIHPHELFKIDNAVECHPRTSIPPELSYDIIKNYRKVNWIPYQNWFWDIVPSPKTITEGRKLFEEAFAAAETDAQRRHIEKSSIQVDYLDSFRQYERLDVDAAPVASMIKNYNKLHSMPLMSNDQIRLKQEANAFARKQAFDAYEMINRKLAEKMLKYKVYNVSEWVRIQSVDALNLRNVPTAWLVFPSEE